MIELPSPQNITRVAIIGTGVIGSGWTAHFLRNGIDVMAHDPAPDAEARLQHAVANVWPLMERLGLAAGASPDRLAFAPDVASAVDNAQFIQENAPEREALKVALFAEIDANAPPNAIIASSTSGFPITTLAQQCQRPQRCLVAHPFNPPYLVPLVEVVGGALTDPAVVDWAVEFYNATGKQALKCSKEIPGFVADRLMEAIWREILHMVNNDMATVEEIDASIRYGPGLRWALMGPCTVLHLAGGAGGMAHMLDQFGPSLKSPWTFLDAPELTPELRQRMIDGCERLTAGSSIAELEQERDELLIEMIEVLNGSSLWHLNNPTSSGRH